MSAPAVEKDVMGFGLTQSDATRGRRCGRTPGRS